MARKLPKKLPANPQKALFGACRDGDEELARVLVELGASFAQGSAGAIVAARGSEELLAFALAHGLPLAGPSGATVLEAAIMNGRATVLTTLLERGAELGAVLNPVHRAISTPVAVTVAPTARREVLEVLMRHGADLNAVTATGLTPLAWAVQRGEGDAAAALVELGADVSSGAEVAAAFATGAVTLARLFAQRGAPLEACLATGASVSAIVERDLLTPRDIEVAYRASPEPQRLRVELGFARLSDATPYGWEQHLRSEALAFERLEALGVFGGMGRPAAWRVLESSLSDAESGWVQVQQLITVVDLSPCELAFALRSLCLGTQLYPARIHVEGDVAPDGGPDTVDSERARAWFADLTLDPLTVPAQLAFSVDHAPEPGLLVSLKHQSGVGRQLVDALVELNAWLPSRPFVRPDRAAHRCQLAITPGKVGARTSTVRAHLIGDASLGLGFDPHEIRALVARVLASQGSIEHMTWCLATEPG